jgi:hypothetical protein
MSKEQTCADSNTNVYTAEKASFDKIVSISRDLSGRREVCTFRGNRGLWREVSEMLAHDGFSQCHLIEPVLLAYREGKAVSRVAPIIIESFQVTRLVTRIRRNPKDFDCPCCEVTWCGRYGTYTLEDKEGVLHYFCRNHSRSPQETHGWRLVEK